jgi:PLP dependent protein
MEPDPAAGRRAQLSANLEALRERIDLACLAVGRAHSDAALVAVTKTYPASDVRHLIELGLTDFGENRDQEAALKAAAVASESSEYGATAQGPGQPPPSGRPRWHFIGQLQTNKVRSVVSYADVIESVDRLKLVAALDDAGRRADRVLTCLIQVNLATAADGTAVAGRGGAEPGEVERIADAVAGSGALRLGGLMAVAPLGAAPGPAFERLATLAMKVRGAHAGAAIISAGMSGDLEAAIAAGATHVRIGSALLGTRPPLR